MLTASREAEEVWPDPLCPQGGCVGRRSGEGGSGAGEAVADKPSVSCPILATR